MRRLLVLFCLSACADSHITGAFSDLAVEPAEVVFERAYVGHPALKTLTLVNRGRATQSLAITVEGPFQISVLASELSGAARQQLTVSFVPADAGSYEGAIRIGHEGGELVVPLRGNAELPLACGSSECHQGLFDPALGACRQVQLADGTACESPCLDAPTCQEGRCVGKPKSCDDGNVCTADTCDPVKGCQHVDTTAQCPAPTNPCRVAVCEPKSGCGETDAADFTPCGPVSCAEANVCFAGSCMDFEPPDGFPCAPKTPCRGEGTCQAKQCKVPGPGSLATDWTYSPAERHYIASIKLADADGNLYVREDAVGDLQRCEQLYPGAQQEQQRCIDDITAERFRIVSLTPEGAVRWSHPGAGPYSPAFVDHGRLWSGFGAGGYEVLDTADGSFVATVPAMVDRLFAGDRIVIGSRWLPGSGGFIITAFDALDGRQLWVKPYSGGGSYLYGYPLLLENDEVMLVLRKVVQQQGSGELVLFDSAGNELSTQVSPEVVPALQPTRGFPVFHAAPFALTGFDVQTSTFKWQAEYLQGRPGNIGPMVGRDRLYSSIQTHLGAGSSERRIEARRVSDGGLEWTAPLDAATIVEELWLTGRGSVFVEQFGGGGRILTELRTSDGAELYSCPLDDLRDVAVIGHGRVYVNDNGSLVAYSVPGLELAKSGWIARDGNPGGSNRPW